MLQTIYENDGDPPALRNPMGSGDSAPLGRYVTGRRVVAQNDQFKFELGCGYRHYHTANLFYVLTGPDVNPAYQRLYEAASDAIEAVQSCDLLNEINRTLNIGSTRRHCDLQRS